ncbi:hypothetical protein P692DRAFT_20874987 [Suillus brevipes Sb2]|nr:hypothetical protein P692DRAFT_20874987 [Suillus brevipes Sb2]
MPSLIRPSALPSALDVETLASETLISSITSIKDNGHPSNASIASTLMSDAPNEVTDHSSLMLSSKMSTQDNEYSSVATKANIQMSDLPNEEDTCSSDTTSIKPLVRHETILSMNRDCKTSNNNCHSCEDIVVTHSPNTTSYSADTYCHIPFLKPYLSGPDDPGPA